MLGIILAAGQGKRIAGVSSVTNKCLITINDTCLIDYNIKRMIKFGIDRMIIVVGYNYHYIIQHIQEEFPDLDTAFVIQTPLLGIADAIRCCLPFMENSPFLMCLADELLVRPSLHRLKEHLSAPDVYGVCGVVKASAEQIQRAYTMRLNEANEVLQIIEKPKSEELFNHFCGTGYCLIRPELAKMVLCTPKNAVRGEYEMGDWFTTGLARGLKMTIAEIAEASVNVNTPEDCLRAKTLMKESSEV